MIRTLRKVRLWHFALAFTFIYIPCFAQKKALNIAGLHQLVEDSKTEYDRQNQVRSQQAVTTANEQANKTMLARLKNKYRELQQRYHALGTVIDAANIGIQASPMVSRIVSNQMEIYRIAREDPLFIGMAYQTETEFVARARSLSGFLSGLCISIGVVNQMKVSDRKILLDYILSELSCIQQLSANLLGTMQYSRTSGMLRSLNPFQNYVDMDKDIIKDIIRNSDYLKH